MELRGNPRSQGPAPGESTVDAFSFCIWAPCEVQSPVLHIVPSLPTVNSLGPTPAFIPSFLSAFVQSTNIYGAQKDIFLFMKYIAQCGGTE